MSKGDVKNLSPEMEARVNAMLQNAGLDGTETAFGASVIKDREFTIDGIQHIKSKEVRDDNFKSVLFRTSLGFVVPVNHIQAIDGLPITIKDSSSKSVAIAACELHDKGTKFIVTKYVKASGTFNTPDYTPSKWVIELA